VTFGFELVVDDGLLGSEPAHVTVQVRNINDPPSCEDAYAEPKRLWPPNHKLVPVKILNVTDLNSTDQVTITVTGVQSDEPVQGLGDGDTSPDATMSGATALLRGERAGAGNGRVYRVFFTATDNNVLGGSCAGMVTVHLPQSMKGGAAVGDERAVYDAMQPGADRPPLCPTGRQASGRPWGISHGSLRGALRFYASRGPTPRGSTRGSARPSF
jgi:hypothetical protein